MLTAVKLMYAGAAVSTVNLISALVFIIGANKAGHAAVNGHVLTAAQASHLNPVLITVAIVYGLVVIALWLWMARANGQGRNWARIVSTVLFALATLQLISQASVQQPVSHAGFAVIVFGVIVPVLALAAGLAAVWLLWRPGYPQHPWQRPPRGCRLLACPRPRRLRCPIPARGRSCTCGLVMLSWAPSAGGSRPREGRSWNAAGPGLLRGTLPADPSGRP